MGGKSSRVAPENRVYGPVASRSCRDVLFLFLIVVFWGGMGIIAWQGIKYGNLKQLIHGTDMYGNLCAQDNTQRKDLPDGWKQDCSSKPYLYYPTPLDLDVHICVSECPKETNLLSVSKYICEYDITPSLLELNSRCWPPYQSTPVLNRCIPTKLVNGSNDFVTKELNARDLSTRVMSDLSQSWKWILASAGAAVVLGFLWLLLMRLFAGVIVWTTILCVYLVFFAITALLYWWAWKKRLDLSSLPKEERLSDDVENEKAVRITSYVLMAVDIILVLLLIWMRRRIALAIGIIKQASKAIGAMPSIIVFPAFINLLLALLAAYWIIITAYLSTAGSVNFVGNVFKGYNTDKIIRGMQVYNFFGFLWTQEFIIACGQTTVALAIASWYWSKNREDVPTFPVLWAMKTIIRYHLGSCAFGALIIAIVRFIRAIIAWIQKRFKGFNNRFFQFFVKCLGCCFFCLEKFLKFINKNAYVMIAIKGQGFCSSCKSAFDLLFRNILRVGVVGVISNFILLMGKVFVAAGATLLGVYLLQRDNNMNYWYIPAVVIGIISYFIASCFMSVYDMAIDTILLSFCEDEEQGKHQNPPSYYNEDLVKFIDGAHKSNGCC